MANPDLERGGWILYFTYGTLQRGFPNHAAYAQQLGRPLGFYRTVERYPLVVPLHPACPNPSCRYEHRICALLEAPGTGYHVQGELYPIAPDLLRRLDELESYDPEDEESSVYIRRNIWVEPLEKGKQLSCQVYFVARPGGYQSLLEQGAAGLHERYTLEMARGRLKRCCRRDPGHEGNHDVSDPFRA